VGPPPLWTTVRSRDGSGRRRPSYTGQSSIQAETVAEAVAAVDLERAGNAGAGVLTAVDVHVGHLGIARRTKISPLPSIPDRRVGTLSCRSAGAGWRPRRPASRPCR